MRGVRISTVLWVALAVAGIVLLGASMMGSPAPVYFILNLAQSDLFVRIGSEPVKTVVNFGIPVKTLMRLAAAGSFLCSGAVWLIARHDARIKRTSG